MNHAEYLILMAGCVLITLPLEFVLKARVYRRWRIMVPSVLAVVVVFGIWDLVGIVRGHWTYNPEFITGIHLGPLPLEELVFFVVIPLCALLSYEGVSTVLGGWRRRRTSDVAGGEHAS